jgi:hypothetical protein
MYKLYFILIIIFILFFIKFGYPSNIRCGVSRPNIHTSELFESNNFLQASNSQRIQKTRTVISDDNDNYYINKFNDDNFIITTIPKNIIK